MTDLRDRFRTLDGVPAPDLWFEVTQRTAMPEAARGRGLRPMNRFAPLAVAATAVVIAILIGIGLLVRPPDVGPSPVPGPTHSATPQPSATLEPTAQAAAWIATGDMVEARTRYQTATLLLDGRVLVAGGTGASGGSTSAELYDPSSGSWTATGSMTTHTGGGTATLLRNGKVLVAGGFGSLGSGHSAELYDPATGSWTATGDMNGSRAGHTATLLADGTVLIAGGGPAAVYDPTTGTWRATGQMIEDRSSPTATLLPDGRVLVAGGGVATDDNVVDLFASAELFDPATGTWSAARDMARGRGYHQAVLLPDGSVLVTGGWVTGDPGQDWEAPAFDELYDPATGTWTATGNMEVFRGGGATATLLPDGTVLAAGGVFDDDGSGLLASAELYDPSSGTWTATVNMHQARTYQTATLLLDGTVLVAGGYGGADDNSVRASAELYDPGSGN